MARIIQTGGLTPDTLLSDFDKECIYNGLDTMVTLEIEAILDQQLDNTSTATYEFSKALQAPILEMTSRGILVDQVRRKEYLEKCRKEIYQLSYQLTEIVREGIGVPVENKIEKGEMKYWWRSNPQLIDLLYNVMGLPVVRKKNANGVMAPTVNRDALEKLQTYFIAEPIILHLLALRDIDKKRSWLENDIDSDGRMRTTLNIAGTNTGRLASSISSLGTGGNMQNIDRLLRECFIADPGYKFGNVDLEQADSRNLGALCWNQFVNLKGEKHAGSYLDACESGDLHTTVSKMARPHLPWTGDKKLDRAIADTKYHRNDSYRDLDKKLGHGTNFVGQPPTMAKHAHVPVSEVELFQRNYFRAFPCIPDYHEWVQQELIETAMLHNLFNRRRFFFGRPKEKATLREAVAFGPQSSTGEEVNIGMLRIWRAQRVQLLMQVHDSLLFQYREEDEEKVIPWACEQLRVMVQLSHGRDFFVPVEAKVGWNWGDMQVGKDGSVKNPGGLIKWKGVDDRKRSAINRLSFGG